MQTWGEEINKKREKERKEKTKKFRDEGDWAKASFKNAYLKKTQGGEKW